MCMSSTDYVHDDYVPTGSKNEVLNDKLDRRLLVTTDYSHRAIKSSLL